MRQRRLLLAASALTFGCSKSKPAETEPPPGNPKGSLYDAAMPVTVDAEVLPPPGNPKGSLYDAGIEPIPAPPDAAAAPADATPKPRDAAIKRKPPEPKPPGNPKGSLYDSGLKDD